MSDIEHLLTSVNIWKSGGDQAFHKPLLLLYALGHYKRGGNRLIPYKVVDRDLSALLRKFGNASIPPKTYYPFWRLRNDGIWEVERSDLIRTSSQGDAWKTDLEKFNVGGGLIPSIYSVLVNNPSLIDSIADKILRKFFPLNSHQNILQAVNLADK